MRTKASMFPWRGAVPSTSRPWPFSSTQRRLNSPVFGLKESVELWSSPAENDIAPSGLPSAVPPSTLTVAWPLLNRRGCVGYAADPEGAGIIGAAVVEGAATGCGEMDALAVDFPVVTEEVLLLALH